MATATLTIGQPKQVTLESTATNLREVVVPKHTRSLVIRCEEEVFIEIDSGQSDGGAGTAANQQSFPAGIHSWRVPGSGIGASRLTAAVSLFVAGTSSNQTIELTAQREA